MNYLVYDFPRSIFLEDDESISFKAKISIADVQNIKKDLSLSILSNVNNNILSTKSKVLFGLPSLDRLFGNGLPSKSIIEIFGSAGSGKTQLCLHLASNILKTDLNAKILFICTQERFPIERLVSMLGPDFSNAALDRVHLEYFLHFEVESHFFQYAIHEMVREYNYKLIIFDGIASNSRTIDDSFEKSEHINQIFASFRKLFLYFDVCALLTNQITDIPSDTDSVNKTSALGLTLENNINIKILLEKTRNLNERCLSVKKSLFTPLSKSFFVITNEGLKGLEEN